MRQHVVNELCVRLVDFTILVKADIHSPIYTTGGMNCSFLTTRDGRRHQWSGAPGTYMTGVTRAR